MKDESVEKGFTLMEVMIVVVIIGILAAFAFPSYQQYGFESRRSEGMGELLRIMDLQERIYTNRFPPSYTNALSDLGYSADAVVTENGYYSITAAACGDGIAFCVQLTANTVVGGVQGTQEADGNLTLDSLGNRTRNAVNGWD